MSVQIKSSISGCQLLFRVVARIFSESFGICSTCVDNRNSQHCRCSFASFTDLARRLREKKHDHPLPFDPRPSENTPAELPFFS